MLKTKKTKCKHCKKPGKVTDMVTTPAYLGHFCDYGCAAAFGKANIEKGRKQIKKQAAKDLREFKANDKSVLTAKAQAAFNKYIRERDRDLPCISCGRDHHGQYHAGHYKTVGARKDLRFNEDNCHKQCSVCNNHLSGNLAEYTPRLINKIGKERHDKLLEVKNKSYTVEELKDIIKKYKKKYDELQTNTNETI